MTVGLAELVERSEPSELVDLGVVFDPGIDEAAFTELSRRLAEEETDRVEAIRGGVVDAGVEGGLMVLEESERAARIVKRFNRREAWESERERLIADAVRASRHALTTRLRGYEIDETDSTTPILYVRARADQVRALSEAPGVSWVFDAAAPVVAQEHAAPNGMSFHKIDSGMNAAPNNLDGTSQRVGLIENVKCAIHDNHDAFKLAPTTAYNSTSLIQPCTSDAQCANLCKTLSGDSPGVCRTLKSGVSRCVDPHLSQVASGIWGTRFEGGTFKNYGAGKATPYVWVGSTAGATNTACVPSQTQAAYDWFNANSVKTVVGSYGCNVAQGADSVDGFIEDWNAARRNVAIFKATGNTNGDLTQHGCRPANAICVGGMTTANNPIEAWRNVNTNPQTYLDREEPDLVAFAGDRTGGTQVEVIDLVGTSGWIQRAGTSFANPLVANMATLLRQKCGGLLDTRYLRTILMASAWYYDPQSAAEGGLAFSTQPKPGVAVNPLLPGFIITSTGEGFDYQDGAGGPTGDNMLGWCGAGPSGLTFDGGPLTVTSNGGTPFTPSGSHGGSYNLTGSDEEDGGIKPLSYDTTNLFQTWSKVYALGANTRFRVVFAWDKCAPTSAAGPGSGPYVFNNPREDFDLFLCPAAGGTCQAQSRSVYDNKEGFDVTVAAAGNYRLSIVYDADASLGCNGSFSHSAAFAAVFGTASNFIEAP